MGRIFRVSRKKSKKTVKKNALAISKLQNLFEIKESYEFRAITPAASGAFLESLNSLLIGTANGTRIGDSVVSKFLELNIYFDLDSGLVTNEATFRVMIVVNHQNNKTTTTSIPEILKNSSGSLQRILSVYNRDFVGKNKKYTILFDKTVNLQFGAGTTFRFYKVRLPIRWKILYDGIAGSPADIINHDIVLYVESDNTLVSWGYSSIFKYIDA